MIKKLPYKDFLKSFEYCPRLTIELVIENKKKEILLLKRKSKPFKGSWHPPGGFLLRGEKLENCVKRIARSELKLDGVPKHEFLGLFENLNGDPRGHILHYVVKLKINNVTKGKFFKSLPPSTIIFQQRFLEDLGYK